MCRPRTVLQVSLRESSGVSDWSAWGPGLSAGRMPGLTECGFAGMDAPELGTEWWRGSEPLLHREVRHRNLHERLAVRLVAEPLVKRDGRMPRVEPHFAKATLARDGLRVMH